MNTDRIRHLAHTFRTALAAESASPSSSSSTPSSVSPSRSAGGRDAVVETGSAPWTGEMAAPSFMILVPGPRR
ncbi:MULTISPECIES: hypothetical protein [unclassified Streptomyces]|uniref:hypothetical protein n=1 Tax=unclassified Streptomyces TaxID=2593676 RepID=UPI00202F7393|nr:MULTISPECIES: hypothetical protein [unclassified Streptomyces]MCM1975838.1 hypothetical protein [Streptomyces sp. G1]MCX5127101.1 hypothetical protein [Streptomyces sp. NBC_00347]MCX5295465.1 hypothetical protein [Streptomyces sp. NBC_00193]